MTSQKKILFIINPISGIRKREKQRLPELIVKNIDRNIYTFSISFTQYAGHATKLAKDAVNNGYSVVVAVGGDGSVNEIGEALVNTDAALAIMPFGSGNGLARHLGIPINAGKALDIINKGNQTKIDVGEYAPGKYFFSNVGIGFAVKVVKWFEHHKVRGFFSYAVAVVRGFTTSEPMKIKLIVEGNELEREVTLFNVCNSNQYGYGVGIAPDAQLDDGKLDIAILNKFSRWRFPWYAILVLLKKHKLIPHYELYTAAACTVINEEKKYWTLQIDGELSRYKEDWQVKILPKSLNIIAP